MSVSNLSVLEVCAARIRAAYCEAHNQWTRDNESHAQDWGSIPIPAYDGGTDSRGVSHANVWLQIAHEVIKHNLDPERFVQSQFRANFQRPITPYVLKSPEARSVYRAQTKIDSTEIARLFHKQKSTYASEVQRRVILRKLHNWTDADIHRSVLGATGLPLSALFRYCVAVSLGESGLAAMFEHSALIQYMALSEDYDRVWGSHIPDEFRAMARDIRSDPGLVVSDPVHQAGQTMQREIVID